jgi:hypothetical protein
LKRPEYFLPAVAAGYGIPSASERTTFLNPAVPFYIE